MTPQTLLIDADDTLWENNVYFDQAIADFIGRLNHQHLSPAEVKAFLYEVERETVMERGYGSHSFSHSLVSALSVSRKSRSRRSCMSSSGALPEGIELSH